MPNNYCIRLQGHLASHWSNWFDNMTISNEANGEMVLCGPLTDQAALYGVLVKIRDLGLPLIAVCRVAPNAQAPEQQSVASDQFTSEN
jgi:hypothetical protein